MSYTSVQKHRSQQQPECFKVASILASTMMIASSIRDTLGDPHEIEARSSQWNGFGEIVVLANSTNQERSDLNLQMKVERILN